MVRERTSVSTGSIGNALHDQGQPPEHNSLS